MKLLGKNESIVQVLVAKVEIDTIYGYLPRFIDVESDDREVTEVNN